MQITKMNLKCGKGTKPVKVGIDDRRIFFSFSYSPLLVQAMKEFEKYRYYGFPDAKLKEYVVEHFKTDKVWSADITQRNLWFFEWLRGHDPYAHYKKPLEPLQNSHFQLWEHQKYMAGFIIKRRRCILAGDMAVGKTLAIFAAMDHLSTYGSLGKWLYVCPRFVRDEVKRELDKWQPNTLPNDIISYDRLRINMRKGTFEAPPQILVLDEAHCLKDPSSLRSRAAQKLADWGREVYGHDFYCILMSGTPSPQDPTDWWSLCEIAQPGYIAQTNQYKLRDRLAVTEEVNYGAGATKVVKQWLDRESLCRNCGGHLKDFVTLDCSEPNICTCKEPVPAKNEIAEQHKRLKDRLVYFVLKNEVMSLPPLKRHRVEIEPEPEVLDLARGYIATSQNGADALNILRQVSDGFRYENHIVGEETCPQCQGSGTWTYASLVCPGDDEEGPCDVCDGEGKIPRIERRASFFGSPKYDRVLSILEGYEEHGRAIIAAGFTGTVDHLCELVKKEGWEWLRCDGRGWATSFDGYKNEGDELLPIFSKGFQEFPKLAIIGNPASIGAGLNLQVSRCIIVVSNSFNAKDRIQLENRIHRTGMDREFGGNIYDLLYLPSDAYVISKIEIKRARQDLSMGLDVDMNEIERLFGV